MVFYLGLILPGRLDGLGLRVFGANYFSNTLLSRIGFCSLVRTHDLGFINPRDQSVSGI